jgi:hypothetical protein
MCISTVVAPLVVQWSSTEVGALHSTGDGGPPKPVMRTDELPVEPLTVVVVLEGGAVDGDDDVDESAVVVEDVVDGRVVASDVDELPLHDAHTATMTPVAATARRERRCIRRS